MLIKVEGEKYNFIDKHDLFVGYDTSQDCCENAGWFISDKPTMAFSHEGPKCIYDVEGYTFDTTAKLLGTIPVVDTSDLDEGDMVIFRLINEGKPALYLHLYNCHNGYYGHSVLTNIPTYEDISL